MIGLNPFQAESSGLPPFITQSDSVFSFFLRPQDQESAITMGGWDLEAYAQDESITDGDIPWIPIQEDSWTLSIDGLKFS